MIRPVYVGAAALLAAATLAAQAPQQAPEQPTPQRPIFTARADLITTDVIVRDGSGQFVPDLHDDEFQIFEDGVPQELVSLVLVHGGRTFNQLTAPPPPVP